jgi:LPXTG-site transpeptidase (sortase) family protein
VKKNSARLILIGVILLLLATLRMVVGSANLKAVPEWEQGDQEGVAEVLATKTAQAATQQVNQAIDVQQTATPFAGLFTPNPAVTAGVNGKNPASQNTAGGETFMTAPGLERTVQPGQAGVPVRIVIPAIGLDAPVVPSLSRKILVHADVFEQWIAPNKYAGGWITASALLGEIGNTVISGHHNEYGEVFGRLVDVKVGDTILIFSDSSVYRYHVANRMILQELDVPDNVRVENARWIGRSGDERLTLVTCWPADSNTHRLILVAAPD